MKIVISANSTWNLYNFRLNLIKSLIDSGHDVFSFSPEDIYKTKLEIIGCQCIPLFVDNKGVNPFIDFKLFIRYFFLFIRFRPDVFIGFTIKPNIYGSIAAKIMKIPTINNITGLGTVFINESIITYIVILLYRISLKSSSCIFFQNADDRDFFINTKIIKTNKLIKNKYEQILPGSGVDLTHFYPIDKFTATNYLSSLISDKKFIYNNGDFIFLYVGRIIIEKGLREYAKAAEIIKQTHANVRFCIIGFIDFNNSSSISQYEFDFWINSGVVEYLGEAKDVRHNIAISDCIVLPSYREGTPRSLLEAAAMEKPIIASDVVGCRDVVEDGFNGFLCKPYDAFDLCRKMLKMVSLEPLKRLNMGKNGRKKISEKYNEDIVISKYNEAISRI